MHKANKDDIIFEGFYTSVIWQTVGLSLLEFRKNPAISLIKELYIFGCGEGPCGSEQCDLKREVNLCSLQDDSAHSHFRDSITIGSETDFVDAR